MKETKEGMAAKEKIDSVRPNKKPSLCHYGLNQSSQPLQELSRLHMIQCPFTGKQWLQANILVSHIRLPRSASGFALPS
jgi:hypothetical protein